jgi:SNF2 family DNA or RNA helicase
MAWKKRVVVGCQDVEGLRQRLVSTCMVNIPRGEVLDLPERTFNQASLVLDPDSQARYNNVNKHFLDWVMANYGEDSMKRAAKAEALVKLMKLWEVDGKVKVKATAAYVQNMVDQDEQVVVMAWHKSVLDGLKEQLEKNGTRVGMLVGGMTAEARDEVVHWFQAGAYDVVIGQIAAAGVGLTLTAAANIVFAQLPWSPAVFAQATDRIYRIGQERSVTVHILNMEGGVSHRLWDVLQSKAHVVDGINNGEPTSIDPGSVTNAVLETYGWY